MDTRNSSTSATSARAGGSATTMSSRVESSKNERNSGVETVSINTKKSETVVPITITWENIRVTSKKTKKAVLDGINGIAKPGEMLALMGASGSGKSTLLNFIMQRNLGGLKRSGSVKANGVEMGKRISLLAGYVEQQEIFLPTLTVDEYLMIQAKLRINESHAIRRERVDEVIEILELNNCRDSRIGAPGVRRGISGGEARRLTFACQLLSNPSLLLVDEPTSGLDSFMALQVLRILKRLAEAGKTLIVTIHQPNSKLFFLFDKVVFLTMGKCAYFGSPHDAVAFFSSCGHSIPEKFNPPEWIQSRISIEPDEEDGSRKRITRILEQYKKSADSKIIELYLSSTSETPLPPFLGKPGFCTEVSALLKRSWIDITRSPTQMQIKIVQKVVMGLFIGSLYWQQPLSRRGVQNTNCALYFLLAELTFSTMYGIMTFMEHELPLVTREHHDGLYAVFSYYLSRCLSYLPFFTLDGAVMVLIAYWMIGLNSTWKQVLRYVFLAVLVEQSASSCGLFLACLFQTASVAISFAVPLSGLFGLLSGLFGNVDNFPVYFRWMQWTSWFRYGLEGLAINQWSEISDKKWSQKYTDVILDQFSFKRDNLKLDFVGLAAIVSFFYVAGYVALFIRIKLSR